LIEVLIEVERAILELIIPYFARMLSVSNIEIILILGESEYPPNEYADRLRGIETNSNPSLCALNKKS
jgi:hypothetical protein